MKFDWAEEKEVDAREAREEAMEEEQLSQHADRYAELMRGSAGEEKGELLARLQRHGLNYCEEQAEQGWRIKVRSYVSNLEIMEMAVSFGSLAGTLLVANVDATSAVHSCQCFSGGSGRLYRAQVAGRTYAVKCVPYAEGALAQVLSSAAAEYLLLRAASAVEAGPSMRSPFGFDLAVYRDCVEFGMEFCEWRGSGGELGRDLRGALRQLHSLRIVHNDIKPENINFSPDYGKFVFVDFGLSRLLPHPPGRKTQTLFRGSLVYCSLEMEAAYFESRPRLVDLYFNDAECLRKSLDSFAQRLQLYEMQTEEQQQEQERLEVGEGVELLELKRRLYEAWRERKEAVGRVLADPLLGKYMREVAEFLGEMPGGAELFVHYHGRLYSLADREQTPRGTVAQLLSEEDFGESESHSFGQRFRQLRALDHAALTFTAPHRHADSETAITLEIDSLRVSKWELYCLKVLEVISVEDNDYPMAFKQKVATKFLLRELTGALRFDEESAIREALVFLLEECMGEPERRYSLVMLERLLGSLFFFEAVSEVRAVALLEEFLLLRMPLSTKLPMLFKFLMAIRWVEGKFQSSYNFERLEDAYWTRAAAYLRALPPLTAAPDFLYHRILISLVEERLGGQRLLESNLQSGITRVSRRFLEEVYEYVCVHEVQEGRPGALERCVRAASERVRRCRLAVVVFGSALVVCFNRRAEALLEQQLGGLARVAANYPQLRQYALYVYYYLSRFNRNLLCEESITALMRSVLPATTNFPLRLELLSQLLRIYLVRKKEYEDEEFYMTVKVLKFTIRAIAETLALTPHALPPYALHRHHLPVIVRQGSVLFTYLSNFELLPPEQIAKQVEEFVGRVSGLAAQSACMRCKFEGLMWAGQAWATRCSLVGEVAQARETLLGCAVVGLQTGWQPLTGLSALLSFSANVDVGLCRRSLVAELFEQMRREGTYEHFFEGEVSGEKRLSEVYQYLLEEGLHDELVELLEFSIEYIHWRSGKLYVTIFFMAIYAQIRALPTLMARQSFYDAHAPIVARLMRGGFSAYVGFYLSIVQLSNCERGRDAHLLYWVAKSINLLSRWCRQLINNSHYQMFLFHMRPPARKRRTLRRLHLKHYFTDPPPLPHFIRSYVSRSNHTPPALALVAAANKYYTHIHVFDYERAKRSPTITLEGF